MPSGSGTSRIAVFGALLLAALGVPREARAAGASGERQSIRSADAGGGADAYVLSAGGQTTSTNLAIDEWARIREKRTGDFLWFRRAGKGYVIEDAKTLEAARALFEPLRALEPEQEDLRLREQALDERERALDRAEEDIDREMDRLSEARDPDADEEGDGEMESEEAAEAAEADAPALDADSEDSRARMEELRDRQGELRARHLEIESGSRELETIERKLDSREDALEREAEAGLWRLMDDAARTGLAKPSAKP